MSEVKAKAEKIYFERLSDNFVTMSPGEAIRFLPYGPIFKGGKKRNITKELASLFKLPHFKPPLKLGSHADDAPSGGSLIGIEVGEDGIYVKTELTEKGKKTIDEGDFRYFSPEVVWGDDGGGYEDPKTGKIIRGPLLAGLALLHTPHLGEAAALYSYEVGVTAEQLTEVQNMTVNDDTVQVDKTVWEGLVGMFKKDNPEPEQTEPEIKPEEFTAVEKERDDYKSKIETMEAAQTQAELFTAIKSEFGEDEKKDKDKFGAAFQGIGKEDENIEMLASFDEGQREWVLTKFKAMSAQIDESKLLDEQGENADPISDNPITAYNAAITAHQDEHKTDYPTAMNAVNVEKPELARAYDNATRRK